MTGNIKKNILLTAALLLLSGVFYFASSVNLPVIDSKADHYFSEAIKKATIAYATTRGVNAVVSVLKESEIGMTPAGVGVNIAAGQILDPLDDMTERLSSVLVIAIVSLGIQKIAMEVGYAVSFKTISFLLPLFIVPLWLNKNWANLFVSPLVKIIAIVFVLRIFLPISSVGNDFFYQQFLKEQMEYSKEKLAVVSANYETMSLFDAQESDGLWSKIKEATKGLELKAKELKEIFSSITENLGDIIDSLLKLTVLYVTLFIMQVIVIPLFMLWILLKVVDKIFSANLESRFINNLKTKRTEAVEQEST